MISSFILHSEYFCNIAVLFSWYQASFYTRNISLDGR